jgi:hypothetical protein
MRHSESISNLVAALAKAQAEFPPIPKDKTVTVTSQRTGGKYTFAYSPLETILRAIRPTLAANGLAFTQTVSGEALSTMLLHSSGEWLLSDPLPIRVESQGSQALGSAITYARRYALTAALGLVTEDDDDGNAADGNHVEEKRKPIEMKQASGGAFNEACFEAMPKEEQEFLRSIADKVGAYLNEGADMEAYAFIEAQRLDDQEKPALWSLLKSGQRSAIKKAGEAYRLQQKAAEAAADRKAA